MNTARGSEITFTSEYIKGVLYFAIIGKEIDLINTEDTHYFSIDKELIYENYYSDFGPLNISCVYKYCKILKNKLKLYLNKKVIVHYTSKDPKKNANAAFLLGCYGVLNLNMSPKDALKPLIANGQTYRHFQDATQGDSRYTISILDCLQAIRKARDLGFFDFEDFDCEEYERLNKVKSGDLNWIVPGKFLAFIGPVDCHKSLYHPPVLYVNYFLKNNVGVVIRLNKRLYDADVFRNAGIRHIDLFFPDGTCPPKHILFKFLQISEDKDDAIKDDAIAVHCKAGLGRTGSLIGSYLIKHYRMTSHEAIGWMRICRPGSVIGQQQDWLDRLEIWLTKQGNLYRKRIYNNTERFPVHKYGIYSSIEKSRRKIPRICHESSPSPPPLLQRPARSDSTSQCRPQASRTRDEDEDEEIFLTSCDLTVQPSSSDIHIKNSIRNYPSENFNETDSEYDNLPIWKKYLLCVPCLRKCDDLLWALAVQGTNVLPKRFRHHKLVKNEIDEKYFKRLTALSKTSCQKVKGEQVEKSNLSRRSSGAGEPRISRTPCRPTSHPLSKTSSKSPGLRCNVKTCDSISNSQYNKNTYAFTPHTTVMKTLSDAKNVLMRSSYTEDKKNKHNCNTNLSSVRPVNYITEKTLHTARASMRSDDIGSHWTPPHQLQIPYNRPAHQPPRQRLGRSPSPQSQRPFWDQTRATNTPSRSEKISVSDKKREASKSTLREALSRLKR